MSNQPQKGQSERELKTARTLNTVALVGAAHPLVTSSSGLLKEVAPKTHAKLAGQVKRLVPKGVATQAEKMKHLGKPAAIAAGAGWVGLHGGEIVGDVLSRRAINAQLEQKRTVKKEDAMRNEQSMISKAAGATRTSGKGRDLSKMKACKNCDSYSCECTSTKDVSKAFRRFDSEADRQRRVGMYAGAGAVGAGWAGDRAVRQFSVDGGRLVRGKGRTAVVLPKSKKGLALAALSAGSGAAGIAAYKHGVSVRNQPWT